MGQSAEVGTFSADGIRFRYPENWTLEREDADTGWTVSLQSPGTAFLVVSLDRSDPAPEDVVETALAALREDYPGMEVEDMVETIAGQPAYGHDLRFFKFDLLNLCWIRAFTTDNGTVFLLGQTTDHEGETPARVLEAIRKSTVIEEI